MGGGGRGRWRKQERETDKAQEQRRRQRWAEKKARFSKRFLFLLQKGPSHSPLTLTTVFFWKPDRCADTRRQEFSLHVIFCGFRNVKTESRAFFSFLFFFFTVLFVLCFRCGFKFSVAVGRMHCACQDEHLGKWGVARMQEMGKRKCQVGIDLKWEESALTTLLDRLFLRGVLLDLKPAGPDIPQTSAWIRSNLTKLHLQSNLCSLPLVVCYNMPSIQQLLARQINSPWSEHRREAVQVILLLSLTVPVV